MTQTRKDVVTKAWKDYEEALAPIRKAFVQARKDFDKAKEDFDKAKKDFLEAQDQAQRAYKKTVDQGKNSSDELNEISF